MVRAVFGMTLISHAANFALLATGVPGWRAELLTDLLPRRDGDPLPQAFVLTAIVITMAATIFMLIAVIGRDDDTTGYPDTGDPRLMILAVNPALLPLFVVVPLLGAAALVVVRRRPWRSR